MCFFTFVRAMLSRRSCGTHSGRAASVASVMAVSFRLRCTSTDGADFKYISNPASLTLVLSSARKHKHCSSKHKQAKQSNFYLSKYESFYFNLQLRAAVLKGKLRDSLLTCCRQVSVSLLQEERFRCCSFNRLDNTESPASTENKHCVQHLQRTNTVFSIYREQNTHTNL